MTDPYKVLGVSPTASDSEVKTAYRELAKKYHPDNYIDNPLSDLASDKMAQINEAYDEIMNMRRGGSSERGESSTYHGDAGYSQVRYLIRSGNITEAENILDGIDESRRDAEWYFLKGSIAYSRGWLNDADRYFSQASSMDPSNKEYAAAMRQMNSRKGGYMNGGSSQHYNTSGGSGCICPVCGPCDICNALICTDCCCECMGGDFIACC